MSRIGKIARLPRHIREQLNRRLDDGDSGVSLVDWLNGLPDVQQVLRNDFEGRPISEQNLSEWRQGGFLAWVRLQESWESAQLLIAEGAHIAEAAGASAMPLSDRLSPAVALALGKQFSDLAAASTKDHETRRDFLALLRELARLRQADHAAARLRMGQEQYERQRAHQQTEDKRAAERAAEAEVRAKARAAEEAAQEKLARERAAIIEEANRRYLARYAPKPSKQAPRRAHAALPGGRGRGDPSNQIKLNQGIHHTGHASDMHDSAMPP